MAEDLHITDAIVIPGSDLEWTAVRAGGPGGQNVNKVATKIDLRFDLAKTTALPSRVKARLRELAASRLDAEGRVVITSANSRSQADNLEDARAKLASMIITALRPPKPRKKTRPTFGSKKRRLESKRRQSEKKSGRRRVTRNSD